MKKRAAKAEKKSAAERKKQTSRLTETADRRRKTGKGGENENSNMQMKRMIMTSNLLTTGWAPETGTEEPVTTSARY